MTIETRMNEIRKSIAEGKNYDEYKHLFFHYIEYLEKNLKENPWNIKAICQLAIAYMEARMPVEKSMELMEAALESYRDELSNAELTELMTNLAYFYAEEDYEADKARLLLEAVEKLNPSLPKPYYALGIIYFNQGNITEALRVFQKAASLSEETKYHYNYAVTLYIEGKQEKAADIFNRISKKWREDEEAAKAYYAFGMIKGISGESAIGIETADNLCALLDGDYVISASQLADIYYVCKEYRKSAELYEYEELYPSADWLKLYFYSLYKLGLKEKLRDTFKEIIAQHRKGIEEEQQDEDEDWTADDRSLYVEELKKDIEDFSCLFDAIISGTYIPSFDFKPALIYGCYLIDCPRHGY